MPPSRTLSSPSLPSNSPGTVLLETKRLIIRRWDPSKDAPALAQAANHPAITLNLRDRFPMPYTLADAEHYLNNYAPPLVIGGVSLDPKGDVYYRTWELGYWLTPSAWGKGYATELVGALVVWCFATWPRLNRIEAVAYGRNEASKAVLRKCGFTLEGVRRAAVEKNGEVLDESVWGILRTDIEELLEPSSLGN
ncbi:acyl-CoA N-acyltransferase [Trichoderma citrinoviride]|uniref:Acyl-CoA N-acyltransferase n=1 Tax=Trichoderma citrinoviride TaxID=58853 RepID=A0A2T4BK12_9HYPO|nr:acyl-CoA N-acyltransferase [Trichoderma citrinoviride]PTB69657.1 acyl-CoA N-acyltransferase [Trichoderma citrinoviride]